MKYFLLASLIFTLCSCSNADRNAPQETGAKDPVIGVWITNVDSDILYSDQAIAEGIEKLANLGFNTIYPVVWNKGYTLYPSEVMSSEFGQEFAQDTLFSAQNRDPLETVIEEARKHDLRVIPWFEFGFSSSVNRDGGHILSANPEWAARDANGGLLTKNGFEWMNALHPEVQQFMVDLISEVVTTYDVDGVQGDDRLPAMPSEGGYSDFTTNLYNQETGQNPPADPREPDFLNWKADQLTQFADDLYHHIKSLDPALVVSFSPSIYPWSKQEYLQDWPAWIERGVVDELIPQVYRWDIESYKSTFDNTLAHFHEAAGADEVTFAPGIIIKAGDRYNNFSYVDQAVQHNRNRGVEGEVYFFYEGLFEKNDFLGDSLRTYYYRP